MSNGSKMVEGEKIKAERLESLENELVEYKTVISQMEKKFKQNLDNQTINKELKRKIQEQQRALRSLEKENQILKKGEDTGNLASNAIRDLEDNIKRKDLDHQDEVLDLKGNVYTLDRELIHRKQQILELKKPVQELEEEIVKYEKAMRGLSQDHGHMSKELSSAIEKVTKLQKELTNQKKRSVSPYQPPGRGESRLPQWDRDIQGKYENELDATLQCMRETEQRAQIWEEKYYQVLKGGAQIPPQMGIEGGKREQTFADSMIHKNKENYEAKITMLQTTNQRLISEKQLLAKRIVEQESSTKSNIQELSSGSSKRIIELEGEIIDLQRIIEDKDGSLFNQNVKLKAEVERLALLTNLGTGGNKIGDNIQDNSQRRNLEEMKESMKMAKQKINQLQDEIDAQATYFEQEISSRDIEIKRLRINIGEEGTDLKKGSNETAIGLLRKQVGDLNTKLKNSETKLRSEINLKDEANKRVKILEKEMQLQEDYYNTKIDHTKKKQRVHSGVTIGEEERYVDLLAQFTEERKRHDIIRKQHLQDVKIATDMGKERVIILESELSTQEEYFLKEIERYKSDELVLTERLRSYEDKLHEMNNEIIQIRGESKKNIESLREKELQNEQKSLRINKMERQYQHLQNTTSQSTQGGEAFPHEGHMRATQHTVKSEFRTTRNANFTKADRPSDVDHFFAIWKTSGLESRTELLLRLISERVLIEGCLKRRQEMLLVLHETFGQGQHPRAALLIERGTVILSELLDSKQIQREELAAMNCEMPILRAFCPQKKMEDEGYSWGFTRQIASLNILCKMDLHGWEWSNEMGEWFNEWNGSVTLSQLLTQEAHETIRSQAAHLVAYIADAKTNNIQLRAEGILDILLSCLQQPSFNIRRNAAEALAFLMKEKESREQVNEQALQLIVQEFFDNLEDALYSEFLILILVNMSLHRPFKQPLYESGIIAELFNLLNIPDTPDREVYVLVVLGNIGYDSQIIYNIYSKATPHLIKLLLHSDNHKVLLQTISLIKRLSKGCCGSGEENDFPLVYPVLHASRNSNREIVKAALDLLVIFFEKTPSNIGLEIAKQEGIKVFLYYYCGISESKVEGLDFKLGHVELSEKGKLNEEIAYIALKMMILLSRNKDTLKDIINVGEYNLFAQIIRNIEDTIGDVQLKAIELLGNLTFSVISHKYLLDITNFQFALKFIHQNVINPIAVKDQSEGVESCMQIIANISVNHKFHPVVAQEMLVSDMMLIIYNQDCTPTMKYFAILYMAHMCGLPENHEFIEKLLRVPGRKFLNSVFQIVHSTDESMLKLAQPIVETLESVAKEGMHELYSQLNESDELLTMLIQGTRKHMYDKSGIQTNMKALLMNLKSKDKGLEKKIREITKKLV